MIAQQKSRIEDETGYNDKLANNHVITDSEQHRTFHGMRKKESAKKRAFNQYQLPNPYWANEYKEHIGLAPFAQVWEHCDQLSTGIRIGIGLDRA